jgi:3-oxoacyl-[acyl-carrier protein] reductase
MARLAIVSGGGTGIGRAVASALADEGVEVVIVGRRAALLAEVADELNKTVGAPLIQARAADLRSAEEVSDLVASISAERNVDILVNNAGGNFAPHPAQDLSGVRAQWLANVEGNVLPAVLLTHAVLPVMSRPGGRIVTIGSIAAFRGPATYGGAKAALHPWNAELAMRLAPEGITANIVAPGYVPDTEFYGERMTPEFHAGRAGQNPMNRGGRLDEIAATVVHLAGPQAGFLTGQIIQINGGAMPGRG